LHCDQNRLAIPKKPHRKTPFVVERKNRHPVRGLRLAGWPRLFC
jgi:hypothetical protein